MNYGGISVTTWLRRIGGFGAAALILPIISSTSLAQFSISEFSPWAFYSIPEGPMMIGDFNGNGRSDVLQTVTNTDQVHVWLSQGDGKFDVKEFSPWPGYPMSGAMLIGDFDGDGKSDLLHVVDSADYVNAWNSNGDGTFAVRSFRPWPGYSMTGRMMIGDFDGNKRSDVLHLADGGYVKTWLATDGSFEVKAFRSPEGHASSTGAILIGDYDGDGMSDVFHAVSGSDSADIWYSKGDGTFDTRSFSPSPGYAMDAGSWLFGDFNGDGRADLLHVLPGTSGVNVWLSNGRGKFNVKPLLPWPDYPVAYGPWIVGDFNHDGYADVLHLEPEGRANMWLSNGAGTFRLLAFSLPPNYAITGGEWLAGDFNGDGGSDLLHAVERANYANVWRSNLPAPLTALILVCSLSKTPTMQDCDRSSAVDVIATSEQFDSPIMCMMHGQAYLAGTALGRQLAPDERVKVVCSRRSLAIHQ